MTEARVLVVMGSDSDLPVMKECLEALQKFNIRFVVRISSAHRNPDETTHLAKAAAAEGFKIIIAGAGAAAHLAGTMAAHTPLPVIGVPLVGSPFQGLDSLYATVQMPRGVPVATVAVNGAYNAGLLAVQILALSEPHLMEALHKYKKGLADKVRAKKKILETMGFPQG